MDVDDYLARHDERLAEIREAMAGCLSEREIDVIWRRYGYQGVPEKQVDVAAALSLSQGRIAQLERAALAKIREDLGVWLA